MGLIVLLAYAFLLLPLGCFVLAAMAEIRAFKKEPTFVLRMLEIAAGITALWYLTTVGQSSTRSWIMVCAALLLGSLSSVSQYASRFAKFCVLVGSGLLAFLWYFKGAYHH